MIAVWWRLGGIAIWWQLGSDLVATWQWFDNDLVATWRLLGHHQTAVPAPHQIAKQISQMPNLGDAKYSAASLSHPTAPRTSSLYVVFRSDQCRQQIYGVPSPQPLSRGIITRMAFGFGVGDIIALTTMIVKTIEDIHDAPEELQDLAERVELVEITLESTHEKLPHNAPARNMSNIVRLKDRVKEVLSTIKHIVIKFRDNEGRVSPFHRVMYSVGDKREIAKLVVKLGERTKNLTDFLLVQTWDSTNQIRPLIEQVLTQTRQDQELAKDQSRRKDKIAPCGPGSQKETDIQTTGSNQIDQVQAVLDHILQTERPSDSTLLPDQEDVSVEKEIMVQLEQAGIGSTFTKALIEVINKQRKQLSHAEDFDPISYTGGRNSLEDPKGWIMVIDSYNEGNIETSDLALRLY